MALCNPTASSCVKADSLPCITCASLLGAGRAATLKNAKQKTEEMQAQQISKIVIGKNTAFSVPCATPQPWAHPNNSPRFRPTPHSQDFSYVPGTTQVSVL